MKRALVALGIALLNVPAANALAADAKADREAFFETEIRPVLAVTCSKCHGGQKASGGLRLDSRDALLKGGEHGPAIVPGDPEKSLIVQAIRQTGDLKMPPDGKLADESVAKFVAWVRDGVVWPELDPSAPDPFLQQRHWAFQPVADVVPPEDPLGWSANEVDRFIVARRTEMKVSPVDLAEKRILLRRVYFDLIGLPPTPQQMRAFLNDKSPSAFEKVIDELLASPHYGERWGRYWMDLVHYSEPAAITRIIPFRS